MKFLIIDDDPQFVEILSFYLNQQGIYYDVANTPAQIQNYTFRQDYDLILHDVFFPNKDSGLKSLEQLKTDLNTKHIPIILMTAMPMELFQQEPNLDRYLNYAKKFITKDEEVQNIVKQAIEVVHNGNGSPNLTQV